MTPPRRVVYPPHEHLPAARELAAARARYLSAVVVLEASTREMRWGMSKRLNNAQIARQAEQRAADIEARAGQFDRASANAREAGLEPDLIRAIQNGAIVA